MCKKLIASLIIAATIALAVMPCQAEAQEKWVVIVNQRQSGFPIWEVYISAAGEDKWGQDQLKGNIIRAGRYYKWTISWAGCYVDIKVVTVSGLYVQQFGVNSCGGFVWTIYDDQKRLTSSRTSSHITQRCPAHFLRGIYFFIINNSSP